MLFLCAHQPGESPASINMTFGLSHRLLSSSGGTQTAISPSPCLRTNNRHRHMDTEQQTGLHKFGLPLQSYKCAYLELTHYILISLYCFVLNCTLHNRWKKKIKLQENWLCFNESGKVWTAVFLYTHLGQCSAVRIGWDSCFYLFRCLYPASSFLFFWVRLLPKSPGSSACPFPHISPTQFDIHTFSSSFCSASGITWLSSPGFLCSCSSTCTEFSRQLSLSLSSICLWVQFRVCVLAMSAANHLYFAPLQPLIVICCFLWIFFSMNWPLST